MATTTSSRPKTVAETYWQSTIGKKTVMAVTGLLMVLFLLVHMLGNLKIFFGPHDYDAYAAWLRTIGEPVLHNTWYLWIQRFVLTIALILHIVAAAQLSKRDVQARPVAYAHSQRWQAKFPPYSMRWGGIALFAFIIWHLLDLTAGTVNPHFEDGHPYHNIVADFNTWYMNLIYIVAMIALGFHINHGFVSATRTLGVHKPSRARAIRATGSTLAVVLTLGFIVVPISVMAGLVS